MGKSGDYLTMAEKSFHVESNIRIIVVPADVHVNYNNGKVISDTEINIDGERIIQIVSRNDVFKVETSLPVTQVGDTKFSFDDKQVYYDNKSCDFSCAKAIIAVALVAAYCDNGRALNSRELLGILFESRNRIDEKTLTRYLTEMRRTFHAATGAIEHNFIPVERNVGYRFDPNF